MHATGMNVGLYQSVSGMKCAFDQQQVIAENLANSSVPGARSRNIAFTVAQPEDESKLPEMVMNGTFSLPVDAQAYISFRQGSLQKSNNPYSMALESNNAFFAVSSKNGQELLTRNGEFNRDANGHLVQADGSQLLLQSGKTINLPQNVNKILISDQGNITSDDGQDLGVVKIVRVNNPQDDLTQINSSVFQAKKGVKTNTGLDVGERLSQGYVEQGNTETVDQMVKMISIMRTYEANQKMITTQDDTMEKLITAITE